LSYHSKIAAYYLPALLHRFASCNCASIGHIGTGSISDHQEEIIEIELAIYLQVLHCAEVGHRICESQVIPLVGLIINVFGLDQSGLAI